MSAGPRGRDNRRDERPLVARLRDIAKPDLQATLLRGSDLGIEPGEEVVRDQVHFLEDQRAGDDPAPRSRDVRESGVVVLVNPLALHQRKERVPGPEAGWD